MPQASRRPVCHSRWEHKVDLSTRRSEFSPNTVGSKRTSYQPLLHSQANSFLSKYTQHHWRSHLSCMWMSHSYSLGTQQSYIQTARRSPAHSAHPRVALHQPTKYKLVQEAQTTFPLPQRATQPCADMALIIKTTCVWPTLQPSAEKLCIPFVVVCCPQTRGRRKMYSHLFQLRHKQHPWELWCIPH